jgi:hypothetical protein
MAELQGLGVQRLAGKIIKQRNSRTVLRVAPRAPAIDFVSDQWISQIREVNPDLMCAASFGPQS